MSGFEGTPGNVDCSHAAGEFYKHTRAILLPLSLCPQLIRENKERKEREKQRVRVGGVRNIFERGHGRDLE